MLRIDASSHTYLAVCTCGWHGTTCNTRLASLKDAATHEENCHPKWRAARQNLSAALFNARIVTRRDTH